MYMNLKGKWIKKNWKKLNDEAISNSGDEAKKDEDLQISETNDDIDECYFDKETGKIKLSFSNEAGYFSLDIPIDDDDAFNIINYMKKKGEEIKKLINLAD